MTSTQVLSDFASALASGAVEVVDLTAPLGPETPLIKLPPQIGKNTPPIEVHAISNYDKDGPFWAWNWLKLGEHSGTHFDAPVHWISGRDYKDGSTDTIPVKNFVAPVCVIDCSAEAAKNPDFLLTVDGVKAWEKTHGDIPAGCWVLMRTDWYKRNDSEAKFLNADDKGPHSPGPTAETIHYLICEGRHRLGIGDRRHRRRLGGRDGSAVPGAHLHAQEQPLRPRQPLPSRQAAAQGSDPDRGAAEDRQRHRQPAARARARAAASRPGGATMAAADYVIVGSGINALVAAALLGRKGHKVLVLERNDRIGGCIRTEEITAPGFVHDVMATTFVLFITSPAYAELGPELEKRGLAFAHTPTPTAVLLPDGRHAILPWIARRTSPPSINSPPATARALPPTSTASARTRRSCSRSSAARCGRAPCSRSSRAKPGAGACAGLRHFFGEALGTARGWLETRFQSELVRALFAPWVLHTGLGPESAYSGQMAKVIAFALEVAGAPIVKGGAQKCA